MNHFYNFFFLHQNHIQVLVEFSQLSHKLHSQYGKLKFNKKDIVDIINSGSHTKSIMKLP